MAQPGSQPSADPVGPAEIDADLVEQLIHAQFPRWHGLAIRAVQSRGDNRSFRLGDDMLVRLPSAAAYARQVEREQCALPLLATRLSQPTPTPLARGVPQFGYAWEWSVLRWLDGDTAAPERIDNLPQFAHDLAAFLRSLHAAPTAAGPLPGPDNFHRGGALAAYDAEFHSAVTRLAGSVDPAAVAAIWARAVASPWTSAPVWVHGDLAVGNLLVRDGRLCGVIDFGQVCIGDPACDLVPAWTLFDAQSRDVFQTMLPLDDDTWTRARAWALWKALIVAAGLTKANAWEASRCWDIIDAVSA